MNNIKRVIAFFTVFVLLVSLFPQEPPKAADYKYSLPLASWNVNSPMYRNTITWDGSNNRFISNCSDYAEDHCGLDLAASSGTKVKAITSGWIVHRGWETLANPNPDKSTAYGAGGRTICLKGLDGYYYYYAHLSKFLVEKDTFVEAGQDIAESGRSGGVTKVIDGATYHVQSETAVGAHLHIQVGLPADYDVSKLPDEYKANVYLKHAGVTKKLYRKNTYFAGKGNIILLDPETFFYLKGMVNTTTWMSKSNGAYVGASSTTPAPTITPTPTTTPTLSNCTTCKTTYAGWYKVNSSGGLDVNSGHNFSSRVKTLSNGEFVYVTKASGAAGTSGAIGHAYLRTDMANKKIYGIAMRYLQAVTPADVCSGYGNHYTERRLKTAANCSQGAVYQNYCVICNKFVGTPEAPTGATTAHTFGSWVTKSSATCTTLATRRAKCSVCGKEYGDTESYGNYTAHTWNSGSVTKTATCAEAGVKTYTCTVCNGTKTEAIAPITTHTWNSGVVTKTATCAAPGVKTYTCTVCNGTKTEAIAVNPDAHEADPNKPGCCVHCGKAVFDVSGPIISSIYVTDLTREGYTVYCTVSDENGVTNVKFPTWTQAGPNNGQDDLGAWWEDTAYFGTAVEETSTGTKYKYVVKTSEHNNEGGTYITHIYAYDTLGNATGVSAPWIYVDNKDPQFAWVIVTDVNQTGYTVSCMVTDDYVLDKVCFPTWTTYNGQDDLNAWWSEAVGTHESGEAWEGSVYSFRVNTADHNNEGGEYITHLYAYDVFGNGAKYDLLPSTYIDNTAPIVSNITVTNATRDGYTVECTVTDDYELTSVYFPTWNQVTGTENIDAYSDKFIGTVEGNKYSYTVNVNDYNLQRGMYYTEVNAIDSFGNIKKELVSVDIPAIVITEQPEGQNLCSGEEAVLRIAALGDNLSYQWQMSRDGEKWEDIAVSDAKNAEYRFIARSNHNGNYFRCVVGTDNVELISNPVCVEVAAVTLSEVSVDLSDNIVLNYYLSVPEKIMNMQRAYFMFTWDGKTERVDISSLEVVNTVIGERYKVSLGLPAAQITDMVQFHFYYDENAIGSMICGNDEKIVYNTSIEKYLQTICESVLTDQKTRNIADALLTYGYAAENYFRNRSHSMNQNIMSLTVEAIALENTSPVVEVQDASVESVGYSLILDSSVKARGYFKVNQEVVVDTTEGIMASDLMNAQILQCGDMRVKYYPMEYVLNTVSESEDNDLVYLCKSLYNYARAAYEWCVNVY